MISFLKMIFFGRKTLDAIKQLAKDPGISIFSIPENSSASFRHCAFSSDLETMKDNYILLDNAKLANETYIKRLNLISELVNFLKGK